MGNLKKKLDIFWAKHRGMIIDIGAFLIFAAGISAVGIHCARKLDEREKELEDEVKDSLEKEPNEREKERENEAKDSWEKELEEKQNDPNNQIAGGWILDDDLYGGEFPTLIANDIPIQNLGQFGEELKERYKKDYPDWETDGAVDPDKILISAIVTVEAVEQEEKEETVNEQSEQN